MYTIVNGNRVSGYRRISNNDITTKTFPAVRLKSELDLLKLISK